MSIESWIGLAVVLAAFLSSKFIAQRHKVTVKFDDSEEGEVSE